MSKFAAMALPVEKPGRLVLLHPSTHQPLVDANGEGAYLDLYSTDSEPAQRHARGVTKRRLALQQASQGRAVRLSAEEIEAERIEILVALTAGWRLVGLDGTHLDVPFSQADARSLYADMLWVRDQAEAFVGDRANFLPASSPN